MCIFLNQINTVGIIIRSCFFLCQPVADRIEKDVTGIPNCLGNIVKSVTARINPAFWFVTDVIINSGTPDLVGCRNHVFCQTGWCGNQLKGGTGCGLLLRRIIEQRRRFIMLQGCKIFRIHTIGKFVAVISGITYHGKNFPCFFIRHHTGTGTWFKCKLCRRNLNVVNLFHEKIPWRQRSVFQFVYCCIIIIQYSLIEQNQTELTRGDFATCNHILVYNFGKFRICLNVL